MVNGHSCVDVDHYEAVGILKAAGTSISMKVVREVRALFEEEWLINSEKNLINQCAFVFLGICSTATTEHE